MLLFVTVVLMKERKKKREKMGETESVCVCVCVCVRERSTTSARVCVTRYLRLGKTLCGFTVSALLVHVSGRFTIILFLSIHSCQMSTSMCACLQFVAFLPVSVNVGVAVNAYRIPGDRMTKTPNPND